MMKTHRSTCSKALVVIISALVLMCGCSTYTGQKYGTIGRQSPQQQPSGNSLSIDTKQLPGGTVGQPYPVTTLTASSGYPPYKWELINNTTLPSGLTLDPSGKISGTPDKEGPVTFKLQVTDAAQKTESKYFTLTNKTQYVTPTGIPYTLSRPEYTLTRTPPAEGQKDPTYTVGVTYEADPSQKYTLKIDPGIFADPSFTVKLAAGGTMQATTVTFAEQVTPTITALGTITASFIGIMALLDKVPLRDTITLLFDDCEECKVSPSDAPVLCIEDLKGPICLRATPVGSAMNECPDAIKGNTVGCAMKIRIDTFKSEDEFVELFHYVTEKERSCLQAVKKQLENTACGTKEERDKIKKNWIDKRAEFLNKYPKENVFVDRLTLAVQNDDKKELDKLKTEIIEWLKDAAATQQQKSQAEEKNILLVSAVKAQEAAECPTKSDAQAKLDFFVKMDAPTWSGRNLLYLEREIEKTEIFAMRRPQLTGPQKKQIGEFISYLRRQRAATIGALELYDRSIVLSKFLESIKEKSVDRGHAPATSEFATARSELDAALAQIEARRARVLANAKPAPPPQAPALKKTNLKRVLPEVISASTADGWINNEGKNADDYVLVLKEVE